MDIIITPKKEFNGVFSVPGDKSISHRAVMIGALAEGITTIHSFLNGDDCVRTIACFKDMGVNIELDGTTVTVAGVGLKGLTPPSNTLDVGNSGTTMRLLSGILAGQDFESTISGDDSIIRRPMKRVVEPLRLMGANIKGNETEKGITAPLTIKGGELNSIHYAMPVASAQLKSAIIFASLYADGPCEIIQPVQSRNHTELMINYFGGKIEVSGNSIISNPVDKLIPKNIIVPGDISSAAFLIVAALIIPNSEITITNVGVNPTRSGVLTVLKEMGGNISIVNPRTMSGEPVADIIVKYSNLKGIEIKGEIIPNIIDEIPILAVAATFAEGTTTIADAAELKVKESNRISSMVTELSKMNVKITETDDGMIIEGNNKVKGASVRSYNDHRVAMSLAVAALMADEESIVRDGDCTAISFPNFYQYFS